MTFLDGGKDLAQPEAWRRGLSQADRRPDLQQPPGNYALCQKIWGLNPLEAELSLSPSMTITGLGTL